MWHAHAIASEGRWAAPAIGVEAAAAAESAVVAAREEVESMTTPIFKPFVFVELPLPDGYTLVEGAGVHMNDDGVVVATMNDGDDNYGFIWRDELYADGWQGPIEAGSTPIVLDDAGLAEINDELEICGTRINSGAKAFFLALTDVYEGTLTQIGSGYAQDLNNLGIVVGTAVGGGPVGWWDIVGSPFPLPALPGGDATAANGVTPNTNLSSSLIVGQSKDSSSKYQAVVWYNDSGWQVVDLTGITGSNVGFAIDVNDYGVIIGGVLTSGSISDTIHWYYDEIGDEWVGVSLDVSPLFVPEAINDEDYPEVVGGQYLWVAESVSAGTGTQLDMASMSLGVPENLINMRLTDINNAGEIVGVGQLGSSGPWAAFKLVPYDVNNNGEPDYREILDGVEDDANENWLIDWAESVYTGSGYEGMRVGLHSPNAASSPEGSIDPAQIVRLGVNVGPHGISRSSLIEDEMWIEDIVDPSSGCDCETMFNAVTAWGTGEGRANSSLTSEVLIRVHSMMAGETFDDYETLPDPSAPEDREEALADLKNFAYRFARCIDFLQWGNESFGGARQYVFRGDEFNSACDFTTGTKAFSQLSDTCKQEAIELILAWQKDLMWAALEGSALAGRPLRMTSAGVFSSSVRNGYGENNAGRYFVTRLSEWSNENQVYLSLHNHYQTVADATDAIKKLVGLSPYTSPPWDVPNWRISTEVSAIADFDHDWWTDTNNARKKEFARYFFSDDGDPTESYEDFVTGWLTDQGGQWLGNGARLDTVFDTYAQGGFAGICWAALQWQTGSSWQDLSPYLIGGLRAVQVRSGAFFESTNQSNRFSPLKTDYEDENAGGKYNISGFEPHGEGCNLEDVCPDCN